ncbi:F-box only protein 10-like [Montipora capricornis]|uniref:F-box only protein 10-like n=1 Tax=Montipora capricornis TaxID=246305 RepID=UPI0035F10AF8
MPEKESLLPLELWRVILKHLSVRDLCRCSQVCQEWRELVKSLDSTRWKELFLASKRWKHPNWPNYTQKEPSSWKDTYKMHYLASKQWVNHSVEVRCAPCVYLFKRKLERRRVLRVGPGREFHTIKSAISAAAPFDCIVLQPGVYDEQHVLSVKFPIEVCGEGELGDVLVQIAIEQQASSLRIQNIILQPGPQRSQTSLPVILKVGTGHVQLDNCFIEHGHIQVSSPGSIVIRYCTFNSAFVTLRSVGFSRIENCLFSTDETSAVVIEGLPPVTRQRPISRPVDDWMVSNGINSLGLEDLYDLSVINADANAKNGVKLIPGKGVGPRNEIFPVIPVKSSECQMRTNSDSQVTAFTSDLRQSKSTLGIGCQTQRHYLDTQCRDVIRSLHGCIIRNNCFGVGKGAVLVRRRGHAWIEGNEISCLSHGIRCLTGAKVVILNNRIHDCSTSGIFFRERSTGLVAGNHIYTNKEAGVDIRSGSDPIVQHNHIHNGKRSGVVILDRGKGIIRDNDIYDNKEAGVYILYRGNPVVKHNRIWSGHAAGVAVTEEGKGHILYNDIYGMEWGGVDIRNGGNPVVSNNWIRDGHADGIVIGEGGKGIIMDNDIRGNSGCGVWILTVSKPLIYGNRITDCGDSGVALVSNSDLHHDNQQLNSQFLQSEQEEQPLQPLFFDEDLSSTSNLDDHEQSIELNGLRPDKNYASVDNNAIFNNAGHGIHFSGSEGLLIRGNNLHNNEGCGIKIAKPAEIVIQDNSICRNRSSGVSIEIACCANVSGNGIYGNQKHGIVVSGKGLIKENDVFCNALNGVELRGPGDPYITRNRIQSTDHYGLNILENGRGYVDSNEIYQCNITALYQHPDSTVLVINNRIIPVNIKDGRKVCIINEGTNDCRHDPVGLDLDSPPRPLLPNKENQFPRPLVSRMSMSSSGNGHIVTGLTACRGRSRFCVIS